MSAEVVSASLPKAAHACLTSCSGTHRVERVERSGKTAEAEQPEGRSSCCADGRCWEKMVVMERRLLSIERAESHRPCGGVHGAHARQSLLPYPHTRGFCPG